MNALDPKVLRPELGDFNSIICFRAVVVGREEALGERAAAVALKAAGRARVHLEVFDRTAQPIDHPVGFPEGRYLKAVFARVNP